MATATATDVRARKPAPAPATDSISVRTAVLADKPAILELQRLSLRTLGREHYCDTEIESYLRHATTLEDYLLADGTYFVAHLGERLAGCGGWSVRVPAYTAVTRDALKAAKPLPRVRAMFVHPEFARCGVGRHLLADIESAIWEAGHDEIRVDATLGGLPLYERCGYKPFDEMFALLPDGSRMRFVCLRKSYL